MRKIAAAAAVLLMAGAGLAGTAGVAGAATGQGQGQAGEAVSAAACSGGSWTSRTKSVGDATSTSLRSITTGRHACYDRMVFGVKGARGKIGYHVGYVRTFRQHGTGDRIRVSGGAILEIVVNAPAYKPSDPFEKTYAGKPGRSLPGVNVAGYKSFRDTRFGASLEGQTQVGLGVRARLPFHVRQSGDKVIVDVAHTW